MLYSPQFSPRVFDEKPIKAGIGAGGPSTFEELLERELRSQPRSAPSKASAQGKNIPPRATTPTGKKFDKLKLANRSASSGNVLSNGTPPSLPGTPGAGWGARSVSSNQFASSHLPPTNAIPEEEENVRKADGSRGVKRTHSRSGSKDSAISPRGALVSPRAAISPRGVIQADNTTNEKSGEVDTIKDLSVKGDEPASKVLYSSSSAEDI